MTIFWDWNGTLLDDTDAAIAALNVQLERRGLPSVEKSWYLANFSFPVRPFYARCGIDLDHEDWDALARDYHAVYESLPKRLNEEALSALSYARKHGWHQSIISALRQDLLEKDVMSFGLRSFFDDVYGVDNLDGATKLGRARELLAHVRARGETGPVVLIGDSLHDREVADALGIGCVLCACGGHSAARLRAVALTGDTLLEALRLLDRPPAKVGFFDSGVGGLCILRAFQRICPDVPTEYLADSDNCPYGNRPADEIVRLSVANTEDLLRRGCNIIVVACNTATAAAIDYLRATYPDVPFVGIEPAIKPAALRSKTGVVGVLATAGTFHGRLYNETKARFAKDVTVLAVVADEFVTLVERGETSGDEVEEVVRRRIEPLLKAGADHLVLGCTHFPHLKPVIEKVCAGRAVVIDPSDAVARQILRVVNARRGRCA